MQEVGEVSHVAGSGRVVIKLLNGPLSEGQVVCNRNNVKVARVMELVGPVAHPYASAISLSNNIKRFVGQRIFAMDGTRQSGTPAATRRQQQQQHGRRQRSTGTWRRRN